MKECGPGAFYIIKKLRIKLIFSVCFYEGMTIRISKQYAGEYFYNRNGIKLSEKELEPDFKNHLHRKLMSEQP